MSILMPPFTHYKIEVVVLIEVQLTGSIAKVVLSSSYYQLSASFIQHGLH